MFRSPRNRCLHAGSVATAITLSALAGPASAHVFVLDDQATAGEPHFVSLVVPTESADCDTTRVRVEIPETIATVVPKATAGWNVATRKRASGKSAADEHYAAADAVGEIEWSAGKIPSGFYATFDFIVFLPPDAHGPVYFKTIQTCGAKDIRWVDVPKPGASVGYGAPALQVKPPKQ